MIQVTHGLFLLVFICITSVIHAKKLPNDDDCSSNPATKMWSIRPDSPISYFYLECKNAYIVYNKKEDYAMIVNGDSSTICVFNTKTGFGGVVNLETNMSDATMEKLQSFDMSQIENGNYANISALYEYGARLIPHVTGANLTSPYLSNITMILEDASMSSDVATWKSFIGHSFYIQTVKKNFQALVNAFYNIYQTTDFTVDQGPAVYSLFVSDYLNSPDPRAEFLAAFPTYLIKEQKGFIQKEVMAEFNRLMSMNDIDITKQHFGDLKMAVSEVGTKYDNISAAIDYYRRMH